MSATSLLGNPRLFAKGDALHETFEGRIALALEYLAYCKEYPAGVLPRMISDHLLAILRRDLDAPEAADFKNMFKAYRRLTHVWEYEQLVQHLAGDPERICASFDELKEVGKAPKNNKPGKHQRDKIRRRGIRNTCQQRMVNIFRSTWASLLVLLQGSVASSTVLRFLSTPNKSRR